MKTISIVIAFVSVFLAVRGEEGPVSLRYETMELRALAGEVLSIEDFGTKGYVHDLELLRAKFPIGMSYDDLYHQLLVLKSKNLYCTDIYAHPKASEARFDIFRYEKSEDGLVKETIRIWFKFPVLEHMDSVGYSTTIFSY